MVHEQDLSGHEGQVGPVGQKKQGFGDGLEVVARPAAAQALGEGRQAC